MLCLKFVGIIGQLKYHLIFIIFSLKTVIMKIVSCLCQNSLHVQCKSILIILLFFFFFFFFFLVFLFFLFPSHQRTPSDVSISQCRYKSLYICLVKCHSLVFFFGLSSSFGMRWEREHITSRKNKLTRTDIST